MSFKVVLCFASLLLLQPKIYNGTVDWVIDGDTFMPQTKYERIKVRLDGIDCPEKDQPFGREARKFVEKYKDMACAVVWSKTDRYGRTLGTLWVDTVNVNLELVKEGLAWKYKYSRDTVLAEAEFEARMERKGLWKDAEAVAPWEWRRKRRLFNVNLERWICLSNYI